MLASSTTVAAMKTMLTTIHRQGCCRRHGFCLLARMKRGTTRRNLFMPAACFHRQLSPLGAAHQNCRRFFTSDDAFGREKDTKKTSNKASKIFPSTSESGQKQNSFGGGGRGGGNIRAPPPETPNKMPPSEENIERGKSSVFQLHIARGKRAFRHDVDILLESPAQPPGQQQQQPGLRPRAPISLVKGGVEYNRRLCFELVRIAFERSQRFGMPSGEQFVYDGRAALFTSAEPTDLMMPHGIVVPLAATSPDTRDLFKPGTTFRVRILRCRTGRYALDLSDFSQYLSSSTTAETAVERGEVGEEMEVEEDNGESWVLPPVGEDGNGGQQQQEDRSLRSFLEMATSHWALIRGTHMPLGRCLFRRDPIPHSDKIQPGVVLHDGVFKGVKMVAGEDKKQRVLPAITVDVKVAPLLASQPLLTTVQQLLGSNSRNQPPSPEDWSRIGHFLQGVKVQCTHLEGLRTVEIGGFGKRPVKEEGFSMTNAAGKEEWTTVPEYFAQKYPRVRLGHTHYPGVIPRGFGLAQIPIEVLFVVPGQKVSEERQSPNLSTALHKRSSMPPRTRLHKIERSIEVLGITDNAENEVLRAFGITVERRSNTVDIERIPQPAIVYGERDEKNDVKNVPSVVVPSEKAEWTSDGMKQEKFVHSVKLPEKWMIVCVPKHRNLLKEFAERLREVANFKGLDLAKPVISPRYADLIDPGTDAANVEEWKSLFNHCLSNNFEYVMIVDEWDQKTAHGMLKLMEVYRYGGRPPQGACSLISQHVTMESVRRVVYEGGRQTLENILAKLHCKMGGLNYVPGVRFLHPDDESLDQKQREVDDQFRPDTGEVLVIGLDVCHPNGPTGTPSVVGVCANMAPHPVCFTGDYFYQTSKQEQIDSAQLKARAKWMLESVERHRPGTPRPGTVVVLRDGVSEGQQLMAYTEELGAIRAGFAEADPDYKPRFVLVIGSKGHHKKFFSLGGKNEVNERPDNLAPCSMVSTKVVRPDIIELYVQSHAPIQGTSRCVQYAVLVNETGITGDPFKHSLCNLLNTLAYAHQIVSRAAALPEPVFQADELAKRGENNLTTLRKQFPEAVPYVGGGRGRGEAMDTDALNRLLTYWNDGKNYYTNRFTA